MRIEVDEYCFVCGPQNPAGLGAEFECEEGRATGRCRPRAEHQGYQGISHGGILAALLDEAMVYAAASLGRWVTTAEMTVRYSRPAATEAPLTLHAEVVSRRGRLVECRAEARDPDGVVLATARGKLMQGRALTEAEQRLGAAGAGPLEERPETGE